MPDGVADMFNGIFAMDLEHGSQPQTLAAVTEDPHVLGNDDDFTPSLFGPRFAGFGGPIYGPVSPEERGKEGKGKGGSREVYN